MSSDDVDTLDHHSSNAAFAETRESEGKEKWEMTTVEKIETGNRLKQEGNQLVNDGKYAEAGEKYAKALGFFYFYSPSFDEESLQDEINKGKISLHLNLALAQLKLREFQQAISNTDEVLKLSPDNVKALFRRALGHTGLRNWHSALSDLHRAGELDPQDPAIPQQLNLIKSLREQESQQERDIYRRMVSNRSSETLDRSHPPPQPAPSRAGGNGALNRWLGYLWRLLVLLLVSLWSGPRRMFKRRRD